jgi:hypothetical protein
MEGWHGDGNTARTALMWALAKTQGATAAPWREDVELGAERSSTGGVRVLLKTRYPWKGRLRFDRPRHRDHFRMPADYPRINQFPEWFTAEENGRYRLTVDGAPGRPVTGRELWNLELTLPAAGTARVEVEAAP